MIHGRLKNTNNIGIFSLYDWQHFLGLVILSFKVRRWHAASVVQLQSICAG
jgi:hypothetical protein